MSNESLGNYIGKRSELAGQMDAGSLAHLKSGNPVGPNLRGDALDLVFKGKIADMKQAGMLPQSIQTSALRPVGMRQPDVFVNPSGGPWRPGMRWLDVTTPGQVGNHNVKYGPNGTVWTWTWWEHGQAMPH